MFLKIREKLEVKYSIILGIIPIFLLWVIWFIVTYGRMHTVELPEGIIVGDQDEFPYPGRVVKERTYMKIPGGKLFTEETAPNEFEFVVSLNNVNYRLGDLGARQLSDGVQIILKQGYFLDKIPLTQQQVASLTQNEVSELTPSISNEPTKKMVTRGGIIQPPDSSEKLNKQEQMKWLFTYERVQTRLFSPTILPSPGDLVRSFNSLWVDRALLLNIEKSFARVVKGFIVAFLFVFPLGVLMGTFTKIKAMFSPLMVFGGYLPIPTLVPLSMALFGIGELQKVMFLALGFSIYLLPLFVKAIEEVDNVYLQTAYTLGANRFQVMVRVLLGIAWPNIYDAMRMGFGVGWGYILLAEMVDMDSGGCGSLILTSQRQGPREHIYLILVAIVILAFITDKLWEAIGDYLFPYRSLKR